MSNSQPTTDAVLQLATRSLIRLALFNERSKRHFFKREDIVKICLPEHPRRFNDLLATANAALEEQLGMRLVPVEVGPRQSSQDRTSTAASRRRAVTNAKSSGAEKHYALVSTLPPKGRLAVSEHRDKTQSHLIGLLALALTVIKLSNGRLPVPDLMHFFKTIDKDIEDFCIGAHSVTLASLIQDKWCKQRYLVVSRSDEGDVEWVRWGPRAGVEFGDGLLADLIVDIYECVEMSVGDGGGDCEGLGVDRLRERLAVIFAPPAPSTTGNESQSQV
jgi:hypothetical protein